MHIGYWLYILAFTRTTTYAFRLPEGTLRPIRGARHTLPS